MLLANKMDAPFTEAPSQDVSRFSGFPICDNSGQVFSHRRPILPTLKGQRIGSCRGHNERPGATICSSPSPRDLLAARPEDYGQASRLVAGVCDSFVGPHPWRRGCALKTTSTAREETEERTDGQRKRESTAMCEETESANDERSSVDQWITSSARASTDGGIVRPSALAVLRLMTSSNLVGCSTGRSAGLAPLRILST